MEITGHQYKETITELNNICENYNKEHSHYLFKLISKENPNSFKWVDIRHRLYFTFEIDGSKLAEFMKTQTDYSLLIKGGIDITTFNINDEVFNQIFEYFKVNYTGALKLDFWGVYYTEKSNTLYETNSSAVIRTALVEY